MGERTARARTRSGRFLAWATPWGGRGEHDQHEEGEFGGEGAAVAGFGRGRPGDAPVQVVGGRLDLVPGEEKTEAVPGSWIHLPARLPHSVRAVEPGVMLLPGAGALPAA